MRTQHDPAARTLWRVHFVLGISRLQVCEAELHRDEVPGVQRGRTCGEACTTSWEFLLWMLAISQVQVHFCLQANSGEVPDLRPRIPGAEIPEKRSGDRVP